MNEEYDYTRYEQILIQLVKSMNRYPDELEIGENISDVSDVKIIFDGYGCSEETNEPDDVNMESYAIFIHRDAVNEGFEFPEHEISPWCLIHRPEEEVCIYAWYDVQSDDWSINALEETGEHEMTNTEVMEVLERIWTRYFADSEDYDPVVLPKSAAWPFPV